LEELRHGVPQRRGVRSAVIGWWKSASGKVKQDPSATQQPLSSIRRAQASAAHWRLFEDRGAPLCFRLRSCLKNYGFFISGF